MLCGKFDMDIVYFCVIRSEKKEKSALSFKVFGSGR